MLQREAQLPMAHAEKAAVLSALMLMITSGLSGGAATQCTVASAATPSGDAESAYMVPVKSSFHQYRRDGFH
jgi:hypothetical protein